MKKNDGNVLYQKKMKKRKKHHCELQHRLLIFKLKNVCIKNILNVLIYNKKRSSYEEKTLMTLSIKSKDFVKLL